MEQVNRNKLAGRLLFFCSSISATPFLNSSLERRANLKTKKKKKEKRYATYANVLFNKHSGSFTKKTKVENEASAFRLPLHIHLSFYWL